MRMCVCINVNIFKLCIFVCMTMASYFRILYANLSACGYGHVCCDVPVDPVIIVRKYSKVNRKVKYVIGLILSYVIVMEK